MPFTIDYGPISTAMNLAQQAGQAQAAQTGFQDQESLQQHLLASQQQAAQQKAQEISLALESQRNQNTQQLAMAQMQNEQAYRQQYLGSLDNYRQGTVGVRQQVANTGQQRVDQTGAYQQGELGNAQDKLQQQQMFQQWTMDHGDTLANSAQANSIAGQIKTALANGMSLTDPQVQPLVQSLTAIDQQMKPQRGGHRRGGANNNPQSNNGVTITPSGQPLPSPQSNATSYGSGSPPPGYGTVAPGSAGVATPDVVHQFAQRMGPGASPDQIRREMLSEGWSLQ